MAATTNTSSQGITRNSFAVEFARATGAVAIAATYTCTARATRLVQARLNLSAAGTTAEDFTITLNDGRGVAYDTVLHSQDLSVGSVTDLTVNFEDTWLEAGDAIDVAWANTEVRTYGLKLIFEVYD